MMRARMLAASVRPIADVLIDSLRAGARYSRLRTTLPNDENQAYDLHQLSLELEPENDEKDMHGTAQILRPDEAAAAVLLGKAFERSRHILAVLRNPDTLVIITVPHADFVEPVNKVLRKHVLGPDTPVLDGDSLSKPTMPASAGAVIIFESSEQASPRKTRASGAEFAIAVQLGCPIIAVTYDLGLLPHEFVSLAEHRVVVPALDGAAIGAVIEAVTGGSPSTIIDEKLARRVTLNSLVIAVRADLGAERSSARLRRLLDDQHHNAEGPLLSEMHGVGPAKQWGLDLAADLREYVAGTLPWSACPKGLLISGFPGTGKNSFVRALVREISAYPATGSSIPLHFIATSYSAWQSEKEGHLGNVTAAIRKVFSEAYANRPAIVFIDEIDSLPARGAGRHDTWFTAVLNCLLEQIDGYERREGVVVIAACNDPAKLDRALVRAGRLDHHVAIPLPDLPALIGIFRTHLAKDLIGADIRAAALAARGHTGADVERWVRVARRAARVAGRALSLQDLLDAVRSGEPEWPADVRRRIACHEAGHAIVQLALCVAEPTALSIGGAGGLAESELGEMRAETRDHLEMILVVLLGGRAAEQLNFTEVTAGAGGQTDGSDLARATNLALRMETDFGFGSLGLMCLAGDAGNRDLLMFEHLRAAVGSTIDRAYATALDVLSQNRSALDSLSAALFAAGYLDRQEIEAVLARAPLCPKAIANSPADRPIEAMRAPTDVDVTATHQSHHVSDLIENPKPLPGSLATSAPAPTDKIGF
jgi:cell division protease FtsH